MSGKILYVDDDRDMRDLISDGLGSWGFQVRVAADAGEAIDLVSRFEFDAVVTDVRMRGLDGVKLCAKLVESDPDLPVVVVTAFGSMETAVAALRAGAWDFLAKPFDLEELSLSLARAAKHGELAREVVRLRKEAGRPGAGSLLGKSRAMRDLLDLLDRLAHSEATVLIEGETGTGKELVAREIHRRGRRTSGPFVAVNCAAIPESLLESELFGHVRGAFTGAGTDRVGLFAQAAGGTLLLDEIGDLPPSLQPKLLRVLQERTVRPLGAPAEVPLDVRILAATHRDLRELVRAGTFREDLYFRLEVVRLRVPPLRERENDIVLLARHFLEASCRSHGRPALELTPEAIQALLRHPWRGNVRQLENAVERASLLATGSGIGVEDLFPEGAEARSAGIAAGAPPGPIVLEPLEVVERRHIEAVLAAVGGNRTEAAKVLGLDRKTLYNRLQRIAAGAPGNGADGS